MATRLYGSRWRNLGTIGEGGQSHVFKVSDETGALQGDWALKRLRRKDRIGRFRREVEILKRLRHANIIRIVDSQIAEDGGDDDKSFLVMPLALNGDLNRRLPIYKGHIGAVVEVAKKVALALDCLHAEGIVHRDIKPGNILFPEVGHEVWVSDFGISFDESADRETPDGEVVGARGFTAPELEAGGAVEVKPSADIYSLGQLIFYMLSGGLRVARENVLEGRYEGVFPNGERGSLLRLLLRRMIALESIRMKEMKEVVVELERIEKWEETTTGSIIGEKGRSVVERLQRRSADAVAFKEHDG